MSSSSNNPRRNSDPLGLGDNSLPAQLSLVSSESGENDNLSNTYNLKERLEARMIAKATRESMTMERNRDDLQQLNHIEVSRELDSTYMAGYRQQGWGERGIPGREVDSGRFRVLNWYQGFPPPKQAYHGHSGYTRVSTHTLETLGNGNPHFGFFVGPEAGAGLVHLKI